MNLNRIIVLLVVLITGIFFAATESFAGKPDKCSPWPECKDDGGDPPPPPPPPTGCTDTFPGFLYQVEATRKLPAELHLASTDGCRTEQIAILPEFRHGFAFHMTSDRSKGVIVWREEPDNNSSKIVRRLDFTVDESGNLEFGEPVTILPLVGEAAPDGPPLGYSDLDIWGDATHDLLFLVTGRRYDLGSGFTIKERLIYDLNALTDVNAKPGVREIYYEDVVPWGGYPIWLDAEEPEPDCNNPQVVEYPRFVPSCYRLGGSIKFNPSGTRIYFSGTLFLEDGRREYAEMRINIDRLNNEGGNKVLAEWIITGPEMVYVNGPSNALPRPSPLADELGQPLPQVLPSPEIVMADDQFLDADLCAEEYADRSGANLDPQTTIWLECLVFGLFTNSDTRSRAWESSDAYLFHRSAKRRDDIYRFYVSGQYGSIEEKLIESGQSPDAGQ